MDSLRYFPLGSGSVPVSQQHLNFPQNSLQMHPQLVILSHRTHADEVVSKNGIQRSIHVVVKNSPFFFSMGVTNAGHNKVDLNQVAFEGHLVYDCEGEKEVDFVKVKPVDFKFTPNETGDRLECEVRIKVLTSQHEDMLFKIRIVGRHPLTHAEMPGMTIVSSAIKVISKPEQLKKNKATTTTSGPVAPPVAPVSGGKKRSATEMLAETVARIEAKQEEQQKLIAKLLQQQNETSQLIEKKQRVEEPSTSSSSSSWLMEPLSLGTPSLSHDKSNPSSNAPLNPFDEAFANLIRSYNAMTPEEKPEVIRKLIRALPPREIDRLSELLDLFWTEGLQKDFGSRLPQDLPSLGPKSTDGCSCSECPHKIELEKIDEFYKEFLSSGSGFNAPPPY